MRVLVVHARLHLREVEHEEVRQTVTGLVEAGGSDLRVQATDGRRLYDVGVVGGELVLTDVAPARRALGSSYDVAHVHMVLPWWQVLAAVLLRLRGTPVVLTPMSMLGRDFARASWFRDRGPLYGAAKPVLVRGLALVWRAVASHVVVASAHEAEQAGLPHGRWSAMPLPTPATPLAGVAPGPAAAPPPDAPVAVVSRLDPHRKGFDRLVDWLSAHAQELPRPAAVLYAPADGPVPDGLSARLADGTLVWDRTTVGADLARQLQGVRAVCLLSRWEGQPRVLREAAVLGVPTLTTAAANFAEAVAALGSGVVVRDGDDPHAVHAAYLAVLDHPRDPAPARRLFDRAEVGTTLLALLRGTAAGDPRPVDHYVRCARVG